MGVNKRTLLHPDFVNKILAYKSARVFTHAHRFIETETQFVPKFNISVKFFFLAFLRQLEEKNRNNVSAKKVVCSSRNRVSRDASCTRFAFLAELSESTEAYETP